jgi:glucokinase
MRAAGIDVGGTKCLGVVVDGDGTVLRTERLPTRYDNDGLIEALVELAAKIEPWDTLGVGVAGMVTRAGVVRASPNLGRVSELRVRDRLQERLGRRVVVDNDATCATAAEWGIGAARGGHDVVFVAFGTGIGGGFVSEGVLVRGSHGFAGEIGHMVVDPDGPECVCGRRGCWERFASGAGLARWANEDLAAEEIRAVLDKTDAKPLRGEDVMAAARLGSKTAGEIVETFGRWAALGMANLTNAFDPELLVIGGGLADAADLIVEPIERWFIELLYAPDHRPHPRIAVAELGPKAGAIGAALLAAGIVG